MSISMSSASLPIFQSMLGNLSHFLDKAQAFCDAKKCDPTALTQYRLAPDMLPFTRQVLIACDAAKLGVARLSGVEAPRYEDNETTLAHAGARRRYIQRARNAGRARGHVRQHFNTATVSTACADDTARSQRRGLGRFQQDAAAFTGNAVALC